MNLNKKFINYLNLLIIITLVTSISIISSSDSSFAIKNDVNKKDDKDVEKEISVSSMDKSKKHPHGELKETSVQNNILNGPYPDQFFMCGYPQQLITDYNSFEKFNCN